MKFECTEVERKLLDALNSNPSVGLPELRAELAISRVPAELFEAAVSARAMAIRAAVQEKKCWDALEAYGVPGKFNGQTKAFDAFYDKLNAAAQERAK